MAGILLQVVFRGESSERHVSFAHLIIVTCEKGRSHAVVMRHALSKVGYMWDSRDRLGRPIWL